jgi:hypothetical protein
MNSIQRWLPSALNSSSATTTATRGSRGNWMVPATLILPMWISPDTTLDSKERGSAPAETTLEQKPGLLAEYREFGTDEILLLCRYRHDDHEKHREEQLESNWHTETTSIG